MQLKNRVDKLEQRAKSNNNRPVLEVIVDTGDDEEAIIQEALAKAGLSREDDCLMIVHQIVDPPARSA